MAKIIDIRDHPKFRKRNKRRHLEVDATQAAGRSEHRLLMDEMGPDPTKEELDYLASLDFQADPLENLQTREELKPKPEVRLSICADCEFKKDVRSRWKRFFSPNGAGINDLVCRAFPGMRVINPVTGKEGYLPQGTRIASMAEEHHVFPRCALVNVIGACGLFKPKITM